MAYTFHPLNRMDDFDWTEWASDRPWIPVLTVSLYLVLVGCKYFLRYAIREGWRFDFTPFIPKLYGDIPVGKIWYGWNFAWGVFNLIAAVHVFAVLKRTVREEGFRYTVCEYGWYTYDPQASWFVLAFLCGKFAELFDTLVVTPVGKAHWLYRTVGLAGTWTLFVLDEPLALWLIAMGYSVHGFKYLSYTVPYRYKFLVEGLALGLHFCQIVGGLLLSLSTAYFFYTATEEMPCDTEWSHLGVLLSSYLWIVKVILV